MKKKKTAGFGWQSFFIAGLKMPTAQNARRRVFDGRHIQTIAPK